MKYSIVIPVHNGGPAVAKAICSCVGQSYRDDFEVVVLDNASTDETARICRNLRDARVRVATSRAKIRMYANHNRGLREARGGYVLFCHADDTLLPHALALVDDRLKARGYPRDTVLWGRSRFRDFAKPWTRALGELDRPLSGELAALPFLAGGLTPSGTTFGREGVLACGGFFECNETDDAEADIHSDMVTMAHLALEGFSFEMASFRIFDRRRASTGRRPKRGSELAAWKSFEARHGLDTMLRLSRLHNAVVRSPRRAALDRYLVQRNVLSSRELSQLLARSMNVRALLAGDTTRIAAALLARRRG